jgi:hypothetical protein
MCYFNNACIREDSGKFFNVKRVECKLQLFYMSRIMRWALKQVHEFLELSFALVNLNTIEQAVFVQDPLPAATHGQAYNTLSEVQSSEYVVQYFRWK